MLNNRMEGVQIIGAPQGRGRIAGKAVSPFGVSSPQLQEHQQIREEELVKTAEKMFTAMSFESSEGVQDLPFKKARSLQYLKDIETYLRAQLAAVTKEIEKLKAE